MPVERISWGGWPDCLRLSSGRLEAVATTAVGPRILRFGLAGGRNLLHEIADQRGLSGGDAWRPYGGHRLWHAPEESPRTYAPDNAPVAYEIAGEQVRLIQAVEPTTGIQKELRIGFEGDRLHVVHRLVNLNAWAVELAPWAITMLAPGGAALVPRAPYAPHPDDPHAPADGTEPPSYLPAQSLALWSYTRLDDPRWTFRRDGLEVRQDPALPSPLKFGLGNRQGWCACWNEGELFLKRFPWREGAVYPDLGCSTEVFVNGAMLELESLGPLTRLSPGEAVEHPEIWLHRAGVPHPDDALRKLLEPWEDDLS